MSIPDQIIGMSIGIVFLWMVIGCSTWLLGPAFGGLLASVILVLIIDYLYYSYR